MAQLHSTIQPTVEARPLANFSPSIWGDYFASFSLDYAAFESYAHKVEILKPQVKELLVASSSDLLEDIKLIDLLCHLGISYHFESHIEKQLENHFNRAKLLIDQNDYSLHEVALLFRLFRQHGYNLSSNVFEKFKDSNGKFKRSVTGDIKGLLSLYEATHLRLHGEDVLDEALDFTTAKLKPLATDPNHPLAKQVAHSLEYPIHKCIPRLEARYYISMYEEDETRNETVLEFAKTDFNLVQLMHRQELSEISRWQQELAGKLSYARHRAAELYFWMNALYFEPHYSRARIILTKISVIVSFLDDTYDAYGTPQELEKFTAALQRWNIAAMDELPDYMKIFYKAILNAFDEFNREMKREGRSYMVEYAKKELIGVACAYHQEAKWYKEGYVPKFDEYMTNALKSAAGRPLLAAALVGMGEVAGQEAIDWLQAYPKIVEATDTIGRLRDDIVSHKFEQKRGHCVSAVECYMEEYDVGEKEAVEKLNGLVSNAWVDINEECMKPMRASMHLLLRAVNLSRSYNFVYKHTDGYTNTEALTDQIKSLYVDPLHL